MLINVISFFIVSDVDLSALPKSCRYRKHMEAHWEDFIMNTDEGIDLRVHMNCMPAYEGIRAKNILKYDSNMFHSHFLINSCFVLIMETECLCKSFKNRPSQASCSSTAFGNNADECCCSE